MNKTIMKIGGAAMASALGMGLFTGCDVSHRDKYYDRDAYFRGEDVTGWIEIDDSSSSKSGTGYCENVKLRINNGITRYTGDFSFNRDKGYVILLNDCGNLKRGQKVTDFSYNWIEDMIFVNDISYY